MAYRYKYTGKSWSRAPKTVCITKMQDGAKYKFYYTSIHEAARCLGVTHKAVMSAFYHQHKCQTFEVRMKPKEEFDLTKFV